MLADQHDRPPSAFAELRIDSLDLTVGLFLQLTVRRQLAARGRGDLQQRQPSPVARIALE